MRELKFRVWCKRTQEYHTPIDEEDYEDDGESLLWLQMCIDTNGRLYFIETSNEGADFEYITQDCEIIDGEDAKDFIVEFDTGLKDKNGKAICEGDIVSDVHGDYKGEIIRHHSGEYLIKLINIPNATDSLYNTHTLVEVIGNIHENPELLEEE